MSEELSPSEAAARIGATTRSVQRWIATGRLPARRVGGRWRVAFDALVAFAPAAELPPPPIGIHRIFVANRGEIAERIARTTDDLGIVAIVPPSDGPDALDLLSVGDVVAAARAERADALHPGFGFLAESPELAEAVESAGIRWIGPPPAAIRAMGDKAAARRLAASLGIPIVPGYDGADQTDDALADASTAIGRPLLVKPAAGGGGKGMRIVRADDDLVAALAASRREARAAFGDDRLVLERVVEHARHVEVQVLFDATGHGVHLGERDCSIQRRHQKVLEETPSPAVDAAARVTLTDAALRLAGAVGYVGAGTCEFLLDDEGAIYFLEMNTRLQVEHPVTEAVTGRDLVADQIRIAAGEPLGVGQADITAGGHAIEVRLYAEDPDAGFLPATGEIVRLDWPTGDAIRVDAGVRAGSVVTDRFDPMLAKVIAHGPTRRVALDRLTAALDETVVLGVTTNLRFLRWLVGRPEVIDGEARIDTLDRIWPAEAPLPFTVPDAAWRQAASALGGGWRLNGPPVVRLATDRETCSVAISPGSEGEAVPRSAAKDGVVHVDVDGRSVAIREADPPDVDRASRAAAAHAHGGGPSEILAPMPGSIVTVHVAAGGTVQPGDPILTLEAMKMEHAVVAPRGGVVGELSVASGDQVVRGQVLAVVSDAG